MKTVKIRFFATCTSIDEVKALYRELAKTHHPDKGGDLETMQAINNEYTFICAKIAQGENMSQQETEATILKAEAYRMAIEKIINLPGLIIEVVGAWIWVTGTTREHRDVLKDPEGGRFMWASKKEAWYFRTEEYKSTNRSKMSLDQIRTRYGSERVFSSKLHTLDK